MIHSTFNTLYQLFLFPNCLTLSYLLSTPYITNFPLFAVSHLFIQSSCTKANTQFQLTIWSAKRSPVWRLSNHTTLWPSNETPSPLRRWHLVANRPIDHCLSLWKNQAPTATYAFSIHSAWVQCVSHATSPWSANSVQNSTTHYRGNTISDRYKNHPCSSRTRWSIRK